MAYSRPLCDAANFTATGYVPPASVAATFPSEAYSPPVGNNVLAVLGGYAHPHGDAADFHLSPVALAAVEGDIAAVIPVSAALVGEVVAAGVAGGIAAALVIGADVTGAVGVAGEISAVLPIGGAGTASHGVSGTIAAGIAMTAAVAATVERYELRGEVRQGGILINRIVRAYRRDTGALVGEVPTEVGRFRLHAGFEAAEHYLVPVDLDDAATDFSPPCANRVVSVLAMDA